MLHLVSLKAQYWDLFYSLCTFDIPEGVKSQLRLFADDSYLYRTINGEQDSAHLQEDLEDTPYHK